MTSRAPSPASSSAVALPNPPAPPANTTSLPAIDSSIHGVLLKSHVRARHHHQEHRQDLAVAQVVFEEALRQYTEHYRDRSVQQKFAIVATRQVPDTPPEIHEHLSDHPKQNQQYGNPALGGIFQVHVMQVNIRPDRQRPWRIRRHPFIEVNSGALWSQSQ